MPVDYVASLQDIILHRVQELLSCKWDAKIIAGGLSKEPAQVEKKGNRKKNLLYPHQQSKTGTPRPNLRGIPCP